MGRLFLTLLLAGCTCAVEPTPAAPRAAPESPPPEWPPALVDLEPQPPATRVTLLGQRMEVDNGAMIDMWRADAVARAEADPDPAWPAWPRIHASIEDPTVEGNTFVALLEVLRTARRAERASTGSGSGAGAYDLRVATVVAYGNFERVLYTASRAGYGTPRIVLGEDDALARFNWPRAAPSVAPSEAEIRAGLEAIARNEEPVLPRAEDRWTHLTLAAGRVDMTPPCDVDDVPNVVAGCVQGRDISLSVESTATMGEVMPWVQHLSRATDALRIVSR